MIYATPRGVSPVYIIDLAWLLEATVIYNKNQLDSLVGPSSEIWRLFM